jgi:hypothetical protein
MRVLPTPPLPDTATFMKTTVTTDVSSLIYVSLKRQVIGNSAAQKITGAGLSQCLGCG